VFDKDRPSKDPREVLMRAAMHDAATLAGILALPTPAGRRVGRTSLVVAASDGPGG
jgi:hypothetical protein